MQCQLHQVHAAGQAYAIWDRSLHLHPKLFSIFGQLFTVDDVQIFGGGTDKGYQQLCLTWCLRTSRGRASQSTRARSTGASRPQTAPVLLLTSCPVLLLHHSCEVT